MVENVDSEQPACFFYLLGQGGVVGAWGGIAGGMVVYEDDVRSLLAYGVTKDFRHANDGAMHVALICLTNAHHLVARVQQDHSQVLLLEQRHLGSHESKDIFGRAHCGALRLSRHNALAEREGRDDLRRFGWADVLLRAQLREAGTAQPADSFEPLE